MEEFAGMLVFSSSSLKKAGFMPLPRAASEKVPRVTASIRPLSVPRQEMATKRFRTAPMPPPKRFLNALLAPPPLTSSSTEVPPATPTL